MPTITVTNAKGITTTANQIAIVGEEKVVLTISLDAELETYADGKLIYIQFLTPDGRGIEKGGYDGSTGTFDIDILDTDLILTHDGYLYIQVVIRDLAEPDTTELWKSNMLKVIIGSSFNTNILISPPVS